MVAEKFEVTHNKIKEAMKKIWLWMSDYLPADAAVARETDWCDVSAEPTPSSSISTSRTLPVDLWHCWRSQQNARR